ncbi:MAG TPA: putative DNA-binding domain-containing protein [Nannocystis sp.]|jgi:hypothetical protein
MTAAPDPKASSDEAVLRAFDAAMCELDAAARIAADLPGWLAERGVAPDDREVLTQHRARLLVYRTMVHSRLRGVVEEYMPRTAAEIGKPRLRAEIAAFVAEQAPRTVYFRDIPGEFLAWAAPRWRADPGLAPYLADLATHEWLEGEVANTPLGGEPASELPLALDRPVQLDGSACVRRYGFAVHRPASDPPVPPAPEPTAILAYRDRDTERVRLLELTPRAAALCTRLLAGEALQGALAGACSDIGEVMNDEYLAAMAGFLADLGERGVLLGARAD